MPDRAPSRVAAIRAWWRGVHPPPNVLKRLEPVYYVAITLGIGGPFVYGTASTALADVATPRALAVWGPALALTGLVALVRWGAVQGPVVFSVADVATLLAAPLPRAELVLGRLVRGLVVGAGGLLVVAAVVLIGAAGDGRGVDPGRAVAFVAGLGVLGVLGVAGAALVQSAGRADRVTRRAVLPLVVGAVGLVVLADSGSTGRAIVAWSGPWGWALAPLTAGSAWPVAPALLVAAAALVTGVALAWRGRTPTERHLVRAEARDGAVAALYSMNARYIRRSLARVGAGPSRPGRRLRPPRSPRLAIAWRDTAALMAAPPVAGQALALTAGGTAVCVVNAAHPAAVAAGALAVYAGAARVLEPLRAETDKPGRVRVLLREPMGRVLVQHAIVPASIATLGALVAVAVCAAAGAWPAHGGAVALLVVLAAPAISLCAALSARRGGQLPPGLLATATTDQTGMSLGIILAWIAAWPALGAALGAVPLGLVEHHGTARLPQMVIVTVGAAGALAFALSLEAFAP